jgi:cysteine synthase B
MIAIAAKENKIDSKLLRNIDQLFSFIGQTPLWPLNKLYTKAGVSISAKLEWMQLGGSIKARAAYFIVRAAVRSGELGFGKKLLDATSGNTGIAYASIGAALGIPVALCVPKNISKKRLQILNALNVEIHFSSPLEGTDGAQQLAKEIYTANRDTYYYADQYANKNNWKAHYKTTAEEIWNQSNGQLTHFVIGLGTSGTFIGNAKRLKELNPEIQIIALQPNNPMHGLEGWKHMETAIVPKIYDAELADRFIEVDTLAAFDMVAKVAKEEGLLISPSAAANLVGSIAIADELRNAHIITTFADNAEKYPEVMKIIQEK